MTFSLYEQYEQHWRVMSLDLWGNAEDGFQVNDQTDIGHIVLRGEDYQDDQKVIRALVEGKFITTPNVEVDGDEYFLYITEGGVPLLTLVRDTRS